MMDYYMKASIVFCLLSLLIHQYCASQMTPNSTGVTHSSAVQPRVDKTGSVSQQEPTECVNYTAIEEKMAAKYLDLESRIAGKIEQCNVKIEELRNETKKDINENRKDLESRIDEKIERIVNRQLERRGVKMEELQNKTEKDITENRKDLESRVDEKIERIVNRQLERRNVKMEEFRNETEKDINENRKDLEHRIDGKIEQCKVKIEELQNKTEKDINENRRAINSLMPTSCDKVTAKGEGSGRVMETCWEFGEENWEKNGVVMEMYRGGTRYEVYCDTMTDGGRWTVFQRRMDGSVDFYRNWEEYARGFGHKSGEFWLGLEAINQLTQDGAYELRVDLTDWDGSTAYAKYGIFSISGRSDNYRLTVGEYSGTAGDSLAFSNNRPFSAKNKNVDGNCAKTRKAAWWFGKFYIGCTHASLNGRYNDTSVSDGGVYWMHWKYGMQHYSLKGSEMKFRKK